MRDYEVKQKEVEQVKNKYKTSYIASCDLEIARSDSPDLGNLLKDKKKKKRKELRVRLLFVSALKPGT